VTPTPVTPTPVTPTPVTPTPVTPTPVILDVDTGVDDALALLLAVRSPDLDLRAVTCVAGNADVDQVVRNTLIVLDAAGAGDVPVARGADRPLLEPPRHARQVHGADGMADLGLADSRRLPRDTSAVELLRATIEASDAPVTLVPLAPMTNIALLLRTHPGLAERIERIVFMGGSAAIGNATAVAEFNIWHDPEAAAVVLSSGVPLTMYGLDVFYDVTVDAATAQALAGSDEPGAQLAGRLISHQVRRLGGAAGAIGDAGAVAVVIAPDLVTTRRHPVRVELSGTWTRGQTVVDRRLVPGEGDDPRGLPPGGIDVALEIDGDRARQLFLEVVAPGIVA
jgi:pyrimidine-specific ribonucleoside hydrolase